MSKSYESLFQIGERIDLCIQSRVIAGHIRAIIFTSSKVRYSIWVICDGTTLHNIDSAFVKAAPKSKRRVITMPEDNYS